MSVDPVTVAPNDSLQRVVELLRRRDIRAVPVVEDGKLIGIVTDRDVRQVAPAYPLFRDEDEIRRYTENLTVTAAMTADPMTVAVDTSVGRGGEDSRNLSYQFLAGARSSHGRRHALGD